MKKFFLIICGLSSIALANSLPKLYLYIASNYMADQTIEDFKNKCHAQLVQNYFGDPTEMEAKIVAGAKGYDVIVGTGYVIQDLDKLGKLQTIDQSRIKNSLANIDPEYIGLPFDTHNKYSVPYAYTVSMIGYNKKVLDKLCIVPNTWAVLFEESYLKKLEGKVAVFDSSRNVIGAALLYLGKDPNSSNKDDLDKAFQLIAKASKYWQKYDSTTYYRALLNGELWVAMSYSSDLYKSILDSKASKSDVELAGMLQREGNLIEVDNMVIPVSANNTDLAYCFINTVLTAENGQALANETGSTVPNLKSIPLIDKDVTSIDWIYPPKSAKIYSFTAYTPKVRNQVNAKWIEIKMNCSAK